MMSTSSPGPTPGYGGARQGPAPFEPSKKRKERDGFKAPPRRSSVATKAEQPAEPKPRDNRLLAGYLAHEFLTRGTLFGKPVVPGATPEPGTEPPPAYADVARLLKGESGAHISGVVNPTQLGLWLQKQ